MGRASRRKKDSRYFNTKDKLDIKVAQDVPQNIKEMFPEISPDLVDYLYLEVEQGTMRALSRFEIHDAWMNPDGSVETQNEMISATWNIDTSTDPKIIDKWLRKNEQEIRDYATEAWTTLKYTTMLLKHKRH